MKLLYPSILSSDFSIIGEEVAAVEAAGADAIHVDVMDGLFVPNITVGPMVVEAVSKSTSLPVDVHLMIESPEKYIDEFVLAGADCISVHYEACNHLHRIIQLIKEKGIKVGVALNPATSLEQIHWVLDEIDFVLIMTVNPGFGAQKFINMTLHKISKLRVMIDKMESSTAIQVDGGVNLDTIAKISRAGADIFVVGSAIFISDNYTETIVKLRTEF